VLEVCLLYCIMRLEVPFVAPRGQGAVEVSFGRTWLPSTCGCTGLSSGALESFCATATNHLICHLPSWVGTRLSGGAPDMSGDPSICCHADMAGTDCAANRWHGRRTVAPLVHQACSVIFSELWCFPRATSLGQPTRPAPDMSGGAQSGPTLSTFEPNFITPFWLNLKSSLALR
jgi:hypothetical protein